MTRKPRTSSSRALAALAATTLAVSAPAGLTLAALTLTSCDGCGSTAIAQLSRHRGPVQRDLAEQVGHWQKAKPGAEFRLGDGFRTTETAQAWLTFSAGGGIRVAPATTIRFSQTRPDSRGIGIDVLAGTAEIEAKNAILLDTRIGLARLEDGGRIRLSASEEEGSRIDILVGQARLETRDGVLTLNENDGVFIKVGSATIERVGGKDVAPPKEETGETITETAVEEKIDAGAPETDDSTVQPSPARVDFAMNGGESITVHDSRAPTNIGVRTSECPGEVMLQLARGRSFRRPKATFRGRGRIDITVTPGTHRYRIVCADDDAKAVSSGTIRVRRDSGRAPLPRGAPRTTVDADGRRYTVLYQNRLPTITMRWTNAPPGPYSLRVNTRGRQRTEQLTTARHQFASGEILEGTTRYKFETANGLSSPDSVLQISFDNAAQAASLRTPADGVAAAGEKVQVGGTVQRGSSVQVNGKKATLDRQHRFKAEIVAPSDTDAISIRVVQPNGGVHYYLRHVRGAGQ